MNIIGKEPIHPLLFYSGKVSGYITWVLLILSNLGLVRIGRSPADWQLFLSYVLVLAGLGMSITSIVNLGGSTRLGLPTDKTAFKTRGLYRFSRNPMYVGFDLITVASAVYHGSLIVLALAVLSIFVYHRIILAEERYLQEAFAQPYAEYKSKVRRYF